MPARALTIVVVVMGIGILAGFAVLGATVAGRMSRPAASASARSVSAAHPFAAPPIALPAGAHVEAMSTGSDRVVLDVALADGSRQLVIIDLATGRRLGTVPLTTAP